MIYALLSRGISIVLGTLYPAYFSYKAVRARNVKEYVKWMIYWIVFALFSSMETFTDFFFSSWFPFYYEIKIVVLIWLLSPLTEGYSLLYRKFIHPALVHREKDIDDMLMATHSQSYALAKDLGQRGVKFVIGWIRDVTIRAPDLLLQIMTRPTQMDLNEKKIETPNKLKTEIKQKSHKSGTTNTDIGISDDDEGNQSTDPAQDKMQLTETDCEEVENTCAKTKIRKKRTEDICFSSGADSDDPNQYFPARTEIKNRRRTRKSSMKQNKQISESIVSESC